MRAAFLGSLFGVHEPDMREERWRDGSEGLGLSRARDREGGSKAPAPQPLLAPATSVLLELRPSLSIFSHPFTSVGSSGSLQLLRTKAAQFAFVRPFVIAMAFLETS